MSNYSENTLLADKNTPWYKILALIDDGARVLDVGCSSGNLGAELIKQKSCEVVGLDLNKEDVKTASKKLSAAYIRNIETDDLTDLGVFDHIIFADVIEHLVDPATTLKTVVTKLLKKDGSVIFSIPNMAHIATRIMIMSGHIQYGETGLLDKTHLHYYDRQEVERVFDKAGYSIKKFDWVERFIPSTTLRRQLKPLGLEPNEEFFELSKRVDSTAYEFIGKAYPSQANQSVAALPFSSPYALTIDEQVNQIVSEHQEELDNLRLKSAREIKKAEDDLTRIIGSLSWRITLPLRLVNGVVWKIKQKIHIFVYALRKNPHLRPLERTEMRQTKEMYASVDKQLKGFTRLNGTYYAVIVHLYYIESWDMINEKLKALKAFSKFDLYITLSLENQHFSVEIAKTFPKAHVLVTPNRGRDVLPFVVITRRLQELGYTSLLKLHSKKSPHRDDGADWFKQMLDSLVPSTDALFKQLSEKLGDSATAIVGPEGQYVSLSVNYASNAFFLLKIIRKIYSRQVVLQVNKTYDNYGFFAGTMFWARIDALGSILRSVDILEFEGEKGQIDTTLAHALERAFCLVPEIEKKRIYEMKKTGLEPVAYATNNIPKWSDVYVDPDSVIKD